MLSSKRVVTIILIFSMLLVGACAAPQTSEELADEIYASFKKKTRERIAAGEGDYMAELYGPLGAGEYDTAIKKCEEYRELRPNDPVIYMLEGAAYYHKGEFSIAVSRLSNAIAIENSLLPAYYYRALGYKGLGEYRSALEDLDKLANSESGAVQMVQYYDNFDGHDVDHTEDHMRGNISFHRAMVLRDLGETASAIASLDRSIDYASSDSSYYLWRGIFQLQQQRYDLAYSDFEKTIELFPASMQAWNFVGAISLTNGNYSRARIQFKKANEIEPGNAVVLTNLGLAYWLQGNQVEAFETMGQVLRGEPAYNTYYHTAYFNHLNGRQNKALEYFQKSYELNQNVLKERTSLMNATPATSPTRKFYADELAVAETYLTSGITPAENAHKSRPPTLKVTNITFDPDPVLVNRPFDLHVSFKVDVVSSSENTLPTVLKFTVLKGSKTLFSSEPYPIDAINGESEKFSLHMKPVPVKGAYTINVTVKHQDLLSRKSVELLIK